ncbi:Short-chain dehydrogenase/reductase [Trema orientale]|uniref:Short-chain dehydrogenase/reductase n=1 Tax=Trema orientale TaxID=63057 RepID=A0A2P5F0U3_TREOI|nr:Short-chain dehydrogenase/reductase [Trema orientale]
MTMEFQEFAIVIVSAIGFISLFKSSINFLRWIWIIPPKNLKEYGSWAMITGATDGIGKALAFELASKGLNLVLVGRNPSKLEVTSREIRKVVEEVEVKSIVVDLAKCRGEELVDIIYKEIKGLDIGILINNAGLGYPYPKFLHELDLELVESILKVNMEAASYLDD